MSPNNNEDNTGVVLVKACINADRKTEDSWRKAGSFLKDHRVAIVGEDDGRAFFPTEKETKKHKASLTQAFQDALSSDAGVEVPAIGISVATGQQFETRDKDGNIKFRSWKPTSQLIKNLSSLWPYMMAHGFDGCFDAKGNLLGRTMMENKLKEDNPKTPETPLEALNRGLKIINDAIEGITEITDIQVVDAGITALYAEWVKVSAQARSKAPVLVDEEEAQDKVAVG